MKGAVNMHAMKGGASDYGSVRGEACREEGYHSKVGTVNPELTPGNYNLIVGREPTTNIDEYIKELGVKRKIRADAVRFASIIVDYPKDETRPSKEFFVDAAKGLQEFFGIKDEAVLYAQVHVDEDHDHMHFAFVPIVEKEKTYKDGHTESQVKLSAFEVLTKAKLQQLHPFMQTYMHERGYMGTLHHDDGEKRDKEFLDHKIEQMEKEVKALEKQKNELSLDVSRAKLQVKKMGHQKSGIEDEISKLQEDRDALKSSIDDLAQDEYDLTFRVGDLQKDAKEQEENAQKARKEKEQAEQDIKDLEKDKNALEGQIRGLKDDIEPLKQEKDTLKSDIEGYRETVNKNNDVINKQNATIIEQRGIIKKLGTMGNTLLEPFRRIISEFFGMLNRAEDVPAVEQARSTALEQIDRPAEPKPLTAAEMVDRIKAKKDVYVIESGKEITLNKETLESDRRKYTNHVIDGKAVAFAEPRGLGGIKPVQELAKETVNKEADEKITEIQHKRQHRGR
jgi:predicted  nucleic acid-binding Zn-ribbon protein